MVHPGDSAICMVFLAMGVCVLIGYVFWKLLPNVFRRDELDKFVEKNGWKPVHDGGTSVPHGVPYLSAKGKFLDWPLDMGYLNFYVNSRGKEEQDDRTATWTSTLFYATIITGARQYAFSVRRKDVFDSLAGLGGYAGVQTGDASFDSRYQVSSKDGQTVQKALRDRDARMAIDALFRAHRATQISVDNGVIRFERRLGWPAGNVVKANELGSIAGALTDLADAVEKA